MSEEYNIPLTEKEIRFIIPILTLAREQIEQEEFDVAKMDMSETRKALLVAGFNNWSSTMSDVLIKLSNTLKQ